MSEVSKRVRDAVRLRLADAGTGFNAKFAEIADSYGVNRIEIDWTPDSKNFFQGFIDPSDVDDSTPSRYPMVMLYSLGSSNENFQKFMEFSGTVTLGLDFHLTWRAGKALRDFEALTDAVEDAVYRTINGTDFQAWGAPLAYNGEITLTKRPIEQGGENWRQSLMFRLTFQVDTN